MVWYCHLFQNFPQFIVTHTVKGFSIVNKAEIDVFLELSCFFHDPADVDNLISGSSCFFHDPADVDNLISGSSAFSKTRLNIWKFTVHILLKPALENFEHYFASVRDECKWVVVWVLFGIAFLWNWNENWHLPVLWPLQSFPNLLVHVCTTLTASSLRIWNGSTGIPSPPLALFIVMLPKAHLTWHSRISGCRWVITPSWLSGCENLFCTVLLCILAWRIPGTEEPGGQSSMGSRGVGRD